MDSSTSLNRSISNKGSGWFLSLLCFTEIPVFNANSVDPDQMPHSAASDLDLHCMPITLLRVSRLKWVKNHLSYQHIWANDITVIMLSIYHHQGMTVMQLMGN